MSRETILTTIKRNKPIAVDLPEIPDFIPESGDKRKVFEQAVELSHGRVLRLTRGENLKDLIKQNFPPNIQMVSLVNGVDSDIDLSKIMNPADLKDVEVAILPARLGVAENGAVWVYDKDIFHRVLPFITQHLIVVLSSGNICWNMHEAYKIIPTLMGGFGVFIAGPSKTADIEQALVIGAQGARSFSVILE